MKAVVMAGGEGTRLRPLTCNRPKPLVPVCNKPVMEYIVELLKSHGIDVIFPENRQAALAAIRSGGFDVVLLSYSLSDDTAKE